MTGARAGRAQWLGLALLARPALLLALDLSVLTVALPRLSQDLGADQVEQLWVSDVYGFLVAGFLVTMGGSATGSVAAGSCWPGRPRSPRPRCWPPSRRPS